MDKSSFVQQEFTKRGIGSDWSYKKATESPTETAFEDISLYAYTDKEHSDGETAGDACHSQKKSAERRQLEREFVQKYNEYMRPSKPLSKHAEQYLLDDLFVLLRKLNKKWVDYKVYCYKKSFSGVDEEIPLQIGCASVYDQLIEDKQNGTYYEHALAHYLRVAQNKAIDQYFRDNFGRLSKAKKDEEGDTGSGPEKTSRRKEPYIVSIEALQTNPDGQYQSDRDIRLSYEPFADMKRPRWERDARSRQLALLYLRKLMDYDDEPQKPLAVMYGSCLFQLSKEMDNDDKLTQIAKASTVLSSPEWAFLKMGPMTLRELSDESEATVSQYYDTPLSWGGSFLKHMLERTEDGTSFLWADIVYTETYTKAQTSNWIESISSSSIKKAAREIAADAEMVAYIMEILGEKNRFRKAIKTMTKEESK